VNSYFSILIVIVIAVSITVTIVFSIPSEPEKLSYLPQEVIQRNDSEKETIVLGCEKAYPDLCIPKHQTEISCENILEKSFVVKYDDPNNLDPDKNGLGCE